MRSIDIQVSRTVDPKILKPEWLKKSPNGAFTSPMVQREAPGDLDEAIQKYGKVEVFNDYMKQVRLNLQNELAEEMIAKVSDPEKVSKRGGKAVAVPLD
jgi:hypothetical protein